MILDCPQLYESMKISTGVSNSPILKYCWLLCCAQIIPPRHPRQTLDDSLYYNYQQRDQCSVLEALNDPQDTSARW